MIGGNIVSAQAGVVAFNVIPNTEAAAGLAVGLAILAMSLVRCLHPPGGAAALTAVTGSPAIHTAGYSFAFAPVGINSIVSPAILFYRMSARSYPHHPAAIPAAAALTGLHLADIDAALEEMHESFDISREDLDALLTRAELHARARQG